jgi:hypothetical protein
LLDNLRPPVGGEERPPRWQQGFLVAWLALPIFGSFVVSWLITPIFVGRFLFVSLAPLPLLAAGGVRALRPGWLRLSSIVALFVLAFGGLRTWYTQIRKDDWRGAAMYVASRAAPGDAIVFSPPGARWPVEYYLEQLRPEGILLVPIFPSAPWGTLRPGDKDLTERFADWWKDHPALREHLWVVEWVRPRMGSSEAPGHAPAGAPPNLGTGYCIREVQAFYRVRASLYGSAP